MRKGIGRKLIFSLTTLTLATMVWASDDYQVTIHLMDADLITAVKMIAQQVNAEVVFEPTDQPYKRVGFVKIEKRPFEEALGLICQAAGASYRKEKGVYIIGPQRPAEEKPAPQAAPAPQPPAPPVVVVERIPLKYSRASDIVRIIQNEMMTPDPFAELREFLETTARHQLQTTMPGVQPSVPLRIENGTVVPYNSAPVPTATPVNPATPMDSGEGQGIGGRGGGGFGGFGQPGGFGGQPGGFGGQPGGGGQPGAGAGGAVSIFQHEGLDGIVANDIDNSIIVRGRPEAIEYIRQILRFLDIAPKQVLIRAEFVTVSRNEIDKFGIDWNLARVNLTAGASGLADRAAPVFVNYASGNLVANMRSQLTRGRGRVINAPIITTQNNMPASVSITVQDWILQEFVVFNAQGQPTTFSQPFPILIPSFLSVVPRVNADGTITLSLIPTLTTTERVRVGTQDLPRSTFQTVLTVRRVKNGETIVLGGLVARQEDSQQVRIPILADLPVIGQFFRKKDRSLVESELLIFVTATVIEDDSTGTGLAP